MARQSNEFQGILALNKQLIEQLARYLEDRESKTCQSIYEVLHLEVQNAEDSPLLPASNSPRKLSETVEALGKKIRQTGNSKGDSKADTDTKSSWVSLADQISSILWDYLEILEGCVTDLFQQLDQIATEERTQELKQTVDGIKEILIHHLDDLNWALIRLEIQFSQYRWASEAASSVWSSVKNHLFFWRKTLDSSLRPNLEKCRKYLGFRYQKFADQDMRYSQMDTTIEEGIDKISKLSVFAKLDPESQQKFKKIYRLVQLWQLNSRERAVPRSETVRALRNAISPEKAKAIFKEYDQLLWTALFEKSEWIKEMPDEITHPANIARMQEEIADYRVEIQTLSSTIATFKEFLLKTDSEKQGRLYESILRWIKGAESPEIKKLRSIDEDLKHLDKVMESFHTSLANKGVAPETSIESIHHEIMALLHEMTQPLISRPSMQSLAKRFVPLLLRLDVLASSNKKKISYQGMALNKAMKADWQYQALFDLAEFHYLFKLHEGFTGPIEDRNHLNRLQKFKRLIQQLLQWVKNHNTPRYTHEIELDLNDMKGYLQDFLATAQRLSKEESADPKKRYAEVILQLIEYRYLFGNFFHSLSDNSIESRSLRKQLLFVDQYFEAVDTALSLP